MRIEVQIAQLVLEGLDGSDRAALAAALQERLESLLAAGGVPDPLLKGGDRLSIDAGTVVLQRGGPLGPAGRGAALGDAVAGGIHAALGSSSSEGGGP